MGRNRSPSPARARGSPPRRSPSSRRDRERSPGRNRSSRRTSPPPIDKHSTRTKSPKQRNSASRSPSPRTKRLRRAESERDAEKKYEKEHRNGSRRSHDGGGHREKGSTRETEDERRERRPVRDENNGKSSRSRDERSESPRHRRSRHRSRSPAEGSRAREEMENTRQDENPDGEIDSVSKMEAAEKALEQKQKQKPSFELSGKLADETNRVKGVTLLFNEPPDARKPDVRWRLYVFKAGEVLNEPLYIHRQSVYLFGRERRVADIPTDHPSCSKQHAVIQFRQVEKEQPDGMMKKHVLPYLMDLGSTNKTFLNDNPIEPQRYYELFEKDTIKFGNSSREYVLLHENSAT